MSLVPQNELIKGYVHPTQMAKDFTQLSQIIDTLWKGHPTKPIVAGADEARNMPQFLKALGPGVLTAATFHMYGQCAHDPAPHMSFPPVSTPGFALQPLCLTGAESSPRSNVATYVGQVRSNAPPGTKAIIGESALTGGGGVNGTTNAFVSSMWYADWLGFAAKSGVSAVFRETLMGGYYEIVNKTSYLPNPDAFTMALFSRLMGPEVLGLELNVSASASVPNATEMLRGYAHCSRAVGGATLLLINIASATEFVVTVGASDASIDGRAEWHLTAPDGDIHAKAMELNGVGLTLESNNTAMPTMHGRRSMGSAVHVAAASVVFIQLPATTSPSVCD